MSSRIRTSVRSCSPHPRNPPGQRACRAVSGSWPRPRPIERSPPPRGPAGAPIGGAGPLMPANWYSRTADVSHRSRRRGHSRAVAATSRRIDRRRTGARPAGLHPVPCLCRTDTPRPSLDRTLGVPVGSTNGFARAARLPSRELSAHRRSPAGGVVAAAPAGRGPTRLERGFGPRFSPR